MYPTPIRLSFFTSLLFFSFSSSSRAERLSVEQQLPLIARVGQPYQWTISSDTFSSQGSDNISAGTLPSWLSYSGLTFSGTPSADSEGVDHVTLKSGDEQDSFTLCVTHFPPPALHIPLESQFNASNPSMSSVFFPNSTSALAGSHPTVRVPPLWSFSIGMVYNTFLNPGGDMFYYALQADGSPLPSWLTFDERTITFDGVAHAPEGTRFDLVFIGSDQAGYSAQRLPFKLIISAHDLELEGPVLPVNVTVGEVVDFNFDDNDWIFENIKLDGSALTSSAVSSLSVDTSSVPWLTFTDRTLRGSAPSTTGQYALPFKVTAMNQTLSLNTILVLLPSYFNAPNIPDAFAAPGSTYSLELSDYESNSPALSGHDIELSTYFSPNTTTSFLSLTDGTLAGTIPSNPEASHTNVTIRAYDHTTHAASQISFLISFRQPNNKDVTSLAALTRRRRLVLGLSISLGGLAGFILLAGLMAIIRKCCRVKDSAVDPYSGKDGHDDLEAFGLGGYGHLGNGEKLGDEGVEVMTVPKVSRKRVIIYRGLIIILKVAHAPYGNLGLGIGFTPGSSRPRSPLPRSLLPGSPPPKMTSKEAFFRHVRSAVRAVSASGAAIGNAAARTVSAGGTSVKGAVRKVSGSVSIASTPNSTETGRKASGSSAVRASIGRIGRSIKGGTRKSAISRPVVLFTKDSHQHLRQEVSTSPGTSGSPGSISIRPNPNIHFHAPDGESVNVPEGDGLSLGFRSSPSSSAGHTMETTTTGDTRTLTTGTTGTGSAISAPGYYGDVHAVPMPPPAIVRKAPGARDRSGSHSRKRSTDTVITESSGGDGRDRDVEEAVIATASRAHSVRSEIRSEYSSYAYVPSVEHHDALPSGAVAARPKLVQFMSARGVPVPTLSATVAGGPSADRRVSQVADVVPGADLDGEDVIMTEGMRYVRAFGDYPELDESSLRPGPSRSNSKRSSVSRGRLSPATTNASSSRTGTGTVSSRSGTSYEYPTPLQTAEHLASRRSSSLSRSGSRGSSRRRERSDSMGTGESSGSRGHGNLMMSRILVRAGETFKFKYPVSSSLHAQDLDRKLTARLLYGRGLPAFLSFAIAPSSATSTPSSNRSPGKNSRREKDRMEVEFWGTPRPADVGEIVVGIFDEEAEGPDEERCVGRLVVEVVAKG